jgi:hypothetical protein
MQSRADDNLSCPDCGTSVSLESLEAALHRCDGRHRAENALQRALAEVQAFERALGSYLDSPQGRFEAFYAARTRERLSAPV